MRLKHGAKVLSLTQLPMRTCAVGSFDLTHAKSAAKLGFRSHLASSSLMGMNHELREVLTL